MDKNKYVNHLLFCLSFYAVVCIIVIYSSSLTFFESSILITYCIISSLFFPLVANWFELKNKKTATLTAWYCGIFSVCLILSIPFGLFLLLLKLKKRWH